MSWSFVKREWGAVTYVLTVLVGVVVVPLALYFGHQSQGSAAAIGPVASPPAASASPTASPSASPTSKVSASPTVSPSASH